MLALVAGLATVSFAQGRGVVPGGPKKGPEFVENKGQWDAQARFYSGLPGMDIWVTADGVVYNVYRERTVQYHEPIQGLAIRIPQVPTVVRDGQVIGMRFEGANTASTASGIGRKNGVYNYIRREYTVTDVNRYDEAFVRDLYPGIDARIYTDQGRSRYDLIVRPGADPSTIRSTFPGSDSVRVVSNTKLAIGTRFGDLTIDGLFVYQEIAGKRKQVSARFVKVGDAIGYEVGNYDRTKPLIIDPFVYSTLLGTIGDDVGMDVAADNLGYAYITGTTVAPAFPTTFGAFDEFIAGRDAFVTKFTTDAVELVWSTFLGGANAETGTAIALDDDGNVYVCGDTNSINYPTTLGVVQPNNAMGARPMDAFYTPTDAFVTKLNPTGSALVWSTYLGGPESTWQWNRPDTGPVIDGPIVNPAVSEGALDIKVDKNGLATIVGFTRSTGFPVTLGALEPVFDGPFQAPPDLLNPFGINPGQDGFITKLNANATGYVFSTYMGGRENDIVTGSAIDADGNIFVCGITASTGGPLTPGVFITTEGAFDRTIVGQDAFVLRIDPLGLTRVYSTVLGGNDNDGAIGIDVDPTGDAFVTGTTFSTNYPTTIGAYDRQYNNSSDMFLSRLFRDGSRLIYSTLCGTAGGNFPNAIAVDDTGVAYIGGVSIFGGIPTTPDAIDTTFNGPPPPFDWFNGDGFILVFNDSGSGLLYGTYIGGEEGDEIMGLALDPSRSLYAAGWTNSWTEGQKNAFPTTTGAFREFMINDRPPPNAPPKAWRDAFLIKLHIRVPIVMETFVFTPREVAGTQSSTGTITLSGPASPGGATVSLRTTHPEIVSIPEEVFIPEGDTQVTFTAETTAVLETFTTTVTASFEARILNAPLIVAPYLSALTVSNINVVGGNSITGRVTLFQEAPAGGAEVALFSGEPSIVQMPDTVLVPEGATTAIFNIQTQGVPILTQVQLTALYLGMARSQVINVLPAGFNQLQFNPTRVTGGETARARVVLSGAVPVNTTLTITRISGPLNVTFPPTVVVPAGQNFVEFDVGTGFVPASTTLRLQAAGAGGNIQGSLGIDHTQLLSVVLIPNDVIGGAIVSGRVNLTRPAAPSGMNVVLTNSNPVAGTIDRATVFVPPGSTTSQTFFIQTNTVEETQTMTVTASKPGYISRQAVLLVREPTLGLQLSITPPAVTGGFDSMGVVSINAPRPDDITFDITSSNPNAQVPAEVTIFAGATEATFPITTTLVATDQTAMITVRRGTQSASAPLQILAPGLASLTLTPNVVNPGQTSNAFLTLDQVAPIGGLRVLISSSIPSLVQHPASITIPGGRSFGGFTVKANAVSRPIAVEIICQIQGTTRRVSAFLFINP